MERKKIPLNELEKFTKMRTIHRWLYALKVKSWPKLLVPFLLGQSFGLASARDISIVSFLLGFAFTVFLLGYIVLLNDYADEKVDAIKRKLFPRDCSPKTIPDKILSRESVLVGGLISGLVCILVSIIAEFLLGRPFVILFSILCILVFAGYSLPPIRLNYRGGGELLEMLGVGLMLPMFHFYLQAGIVFNEMFALLLILSTIFALASAMASGLSDEESDRAGGKSTFVTLFGNLSIRRCIDFIMILNFFFFFAFFVYARERTPFLLALFTIPYLLFHTIRLLHWSRFSFTNAFTAQRIYKDHIHFAIWGSLLFTSIFALFMRIFPWLVNL
jgi:1,4-dihydroxy-2-naphthoate octaprenyltransferase